MDGQERTRWLQQQEQRYVWDPLDYYLGPTGIPQRVRGLMTLAGEVAPSTAIMRSMQGAGRAADSGLPADERARAGLESLVEAGTVVVPSAIAARAANLSRASRGMRPSSSAAAQGLDEAVLGVGAVRDAQQEIFDQGRRNFLRGAGAAVLATRLPSEDLLADTGRYLDELARPATRLSDIASGIAQRARVLDDIRIDRDLAWENLPTRGSFDEYAREVAKVRAPFGEAKGKLAGESLDELARMKAPAADELAALSNEDLLGVRDMFREFDELIDPDAAFDVGGAAADEIAAYEAEMGQLWERFKDLSIEDADRLLDLRRTFDDELARRRLDDLGSRAGLFADFGYNTREAAIQNAEGRISDRDFDLYMDEVDARRNGRTPRSDTKSPEPGSAAQFLSEEP